MENERNVQVKSFFPHPHQSIRFFAEASTKKSASVAGWGDPYINGMSWN